MHRDSVLEKIWLKVSSECPYVNEEWERLTVLISKRFFLRKETRELK